MLSVNRTGERPIWQQLLDQAIDHISTGKWPPGTQLLPTRELAAQLGVSRSTVQIVYEELFSRGYTVTSRRGGTRVSQWRMDEPLAEPEHAHLGPELPDMPQLERAVIQMQNWVGDKQQPEGPFIDFNPHEPYLDETFYRIWRQTYLQTSADGSSRDWAYGDPYGLPQLREQICRYLSLERGIHVDCDQILLTSGAAHSLDLIAQSLLEQGNIVSVEDPGFPSAWTTMAYRGMQVAGVPVDKHGLCVDQLSPASRLVFTTPSHQCAVGSILSEPRRQQLLHLAVKQSLWLVEDDYDSEFRYRGDPLPTLFSQLPTHTLYMMSFSKMIAPGVRISAIVGPHHAIARMSGLQEMLFRHLPIMEQLTLARFIAAGHFTRHMRRVRQVYRRRHETMSKAIHASGLSRRFTLSGVETGLHMLLEAEPSFNEQAATERALAHGIRVYPLSRYGLDSTRKGWLLGFAQVNEEEIESGVAQLANILLDASLNP